MKTEEELKTYYDGLEGTFEGYIQMSDSELKSFTSKPTWESLHTEKNFIFEGCLFDGDRSIMIRQINDKFTVIDEKISTIQNKSQELFFAKDGSKIKIIQAWEEVEDKYCEGFPVLRANKQLFAGFEKGDKS